MKISEPKTVNKIIPWYKYTIEIGRPNSICKTSALTKTIDIKKKKFLKAIDIKSKNVSYYKSVLFFSSIVFILILLTINPCKVRVNFLLILTYNNNKQI